MLKDSGNWKAPKSKLPALSSPDSSAPSTLGSSSKCSFIWKAGRLPCAMQICCACSHKELINAVAVAMGTGGYQNGLVICSLSALQVWVWGVFGFWWYFFCCWVGFFPLCVCAYVLFFFSLWDGEINVLGKVNSWTTGSADLKRQGEPLCVAPPKCWEQD